MRQSKSRPRLITHNQTAIDGRVAISPGHLLLFDERWPKTEGDGYLDVMARHRPQVILEGSGSFVIDGQKPASLPTAVESEAELRCDFLPAEVMARATAGWFTVVDSRGRVRWMYKEFPDEAWAGWHLLVLVSEATPLDYLSYLRKEQIPYLIAGSARVDLAAALAKLQTQLEVKTVVATGGARLSGALLRAGLIDEIEVEVLPLAVGGSQTPGLFTATDLTSDQHPAGLKLLEIKERPGGRVLLRYSVEQDR